MEKVYVYYHANHGDLASDSDIVTDMKLFESKEDAIVQAIDDIVGYTYDSEWEFVINESSCHTEDPLYMMDKDEFLSYVTDMVERIFDCDSSSIILFGEKQDNWNEYFSINIVRREIL